MRLSAPIRRLFAVEYSDTPSLGKSQFIEIIQIDDKYLGLYCMVVLASILVGWDNPHWNSPWVLGLWIAFTATNLLISQVSRRTESFILIEPIRTFVSLGLLTAMFYATGGAVGGFWYGYAIMIMGCSTVYLTVHLKDSLPLLMFPVTYAVLYFSDVGLADSQAVGRGLAQVGFLTLLSFFLVALMKYLLRHAADLEKQRSLLVQSSKLSSLGEMAAGIAHEINNPLAIISGKAQQLRAGAARGNLTAGQLEASAEIIHETANRIARIIRGLRSFAKEGDSQARENSSVQTIVADTLVFCDARFRYHNVGLELNLPQNELQVHCSPVQISQVILNLLNNAYDAVQPLPERWVKLEAREVEDAVEIAVTDSGAGIPHELQARIMEPFFTTKEPGKGTGLGLSISKGIAESHRGELTIDPDAPNTRFLLRLPRVPGSPGKETLL